MGGKSKIILKSSFLQAVHHCSLLKCSSNSVSSVIELGYIYDIFFNIESKFNSALFLKISVKFWTIK